MWTVFVKHINLPTFWLLTCKSTSLRTDVGCTDSCDWSSDVKETNTSYYTCTDNCDWSRQWVIDVKEVNATEFMVFVLFNLLSQSDVYDCSVFVWFWLMFVLFDKEEEVPREENSALLWVCPWVLSSTVPTTQVRSPIYRPFYTLRFHDHHLLNNVS